jgi:hypothetical protein
VLLEQPLDDLDCAVDARAERPRRGEEDPPAHAFPSGSQDSSWLQSLERLRPA